MKNKNLRYLSLDIVLQSQFHILRICDSYCKIYNHFLKITFLKRFYSKMLRRAFFFWFCIIFILLVSWKCLSQMKLKLHWKMRWMKNLLLLHLHIFLLKMISGSIINLNRSINISLSRVQQKQNCNLTLFFSRNSSSFYYI